MANQRMQIDPEKFAAQFMATVNITLDPDKSNMESATKEALAAYLSAYYLAQRFNNTENEFFADPDRNKKTSGYQRILGELNQY